MEQASHPSYILDAMRAKKETATRRNRQLCSIPPVQRDESPDWRLAPQAQ